MSEWPAATRADHLRFCRLEKWAEVRNARGRTGSHHLTLQLELADGRTLRTRISHPAADRSETYGPSMWRHILVDQLDVSEDEFWNFLNTRTPPMRSMAPVVSANAIPAELVHLLRTRAHLSHSQIAAMTKSEAVEAMRRIWTDE